MVHGFTASKPVWHLRFFQIKYSKPRKIIFKIKFDQVMNAFETWFFDFQISNAAQVIGERGAETIRKIGEDFNNNTIQNVDRMLVSKAILFSWIEKCHDVFVFKKKIEMNKKRNQTFRISSARKRTIGLSFL